MPVDIFAEFAGQPIWLWAAFFHLSVSSSGWILES